MAHATPASPVFSFAPKKVTFQVASWKLSRIFLKTLTLTGFTKLVDWRGWGWEWGRLMGQEVGEQGFSLEWSSNSLWGRLTLYSNCSAG